MLRRKIQNLEDENVSLKVRLSARIFCIAYNSDANRCRCYIQLEPENCSCIEEKLLVCLCMKSYLTTVFKLKVVRNTVLCSVVTFNYCKQVGTLGTINNSYC